MNSKTARQLRKFAEKQHLNLTELKQLWNRATDVQKKAYRAVFAAMEDSK